MSGLKVAQQPFWLGKTALAFFFLIFIACAASLVALDRVIVSRKGLPLNVSSSSYSWTYGPTAILIAILSFWRRVDYYYKLREPWCELLAGPSSANKSLLQDCNRQRNAGPVDRNAMEKSQKPAEVLVVDEKVPTIRPLGPNSGNPPGAADVLFQLMYAQLGRPDNLDSFYKTYLLKNATIVDRTSKLILQVLLATMTDFSLIGFCLVKIKGTLPQDHCSARSTMALLAGSQICDQGSGIIPEAGQQMSESQLRRVFDGWVFSLGWWSYGSSVAPSLAPEDIQGSDTVRKLVSGTVITEMPGEQRFGVDVGKANG